MSSISDRPGASRRRRLLALFAGLLAAGQAQGQAPLAGPTYEFSFSNPGARSMGFGGAFVALADDATAAFANPAGLVQLTRPEVSVEGRHWSYSTPFTRGGRLVGEPTGIGLDDVRGLRRGEDSEDVTRMSFLSLVYPQKKWSLAFYRHHLANFASSAQTQGLFGPESECCDERYPDARTSTDFRIIGYGLSGAYQLTERLSLGGTLIWFDGYWELLGQNYFPDADSPGSEFLPGSYRPDRSYVRTAVTMDDTDWSGTLGLLWRFADRWRLGAVFRDAPNFDFLARSFAGPVYGQLPPDSLLVETDSAADFPDVFGLGLSYRSPGGRLTVGLETDWVEYSTLIGSTNPDLGTAGLRLDDGVEIRAGAEWVFARSSPVIGVRLGVWRNPKHTTEYAGPSVYRRSLLPPGNNHVHLAAGVGVAFERFKVDLAVDFSPLVDTVSLSSIYSF